MDFNGQDIKTITKKNEKLFSYYLIAPTIITVFDSIALFILGCVFADVSALYLLIFWLGGGLFCVLQYFALSIMLSHKILHIIYLKKLTESKSQEESKYLPHKPMHKDSFNEKESDLPII